MDFNEFSCIMDFNIENENGKKKLSRQELQRIRNVALQFNGLGIILKYMSRISWNSHN